MYTDKVVEHFTNPRNVGEMPDADGIGAVGSPKCGDVIKFFLKIEDNVVKDVKFKTYGCGAAIASSSVATELVMGKTVQEVAGVTNALVLEELGGLPSEKIHCSCLAEEALQAALWDYAEKNGVVIEGLKAPVNER